MEMKIYKNGFTFIQDNRFNGKSIEQLDKELKDVLLKNSKIKIYHESAVRDVDFGDVARQKRKDYIIERSGLSLNGLYDIINNIQATKIKIL